MDDQKGAHVRASLSLSSVSASSFAAAAPPKEELLPPVGGGQRVRFSVDLKPGETTIVSWKRLLKESSKGCGGGFPPNALAADPLLDSLAQAGGPPAANELEDAVPPTNRFSAVIEKIERLYVGKQSSDEELDDIPCDDQYDTEDSFIDDTELDEYFQVDKMSTKHNGYFVNKGKLEQIEPSTSLKEAPSKRRRNDSTNLHGDGNVLVPSGPVNVGNMHIKGAARNAPEVGRKPKPGKIYATYGVGEHYSEEGRHIKYKSKGTTTAYKRKSSDFTIKSEKQSTKVSDSLQSITRVPYKDGFLRPLELKCLDKHKDVVLALKNTGHRSRASDSFGPLYQVSCNEGHMEFQSKKSLHSDAGEVYATIRSKERYGSSDFLAMNSPGSAHPMHEAQHLSTRAKGSSSVRPKGTTLERAIYDLEKIVAECRPPSLDVQEVDLAFQGIKRRLPKEVKQKLAKVARLSASQGKISEDELVDRLMGILGHLVQRRTLKRNMRVMVELGLSAKQQKADRFHQVKGAVTEMIRARVSQLKSKGMNEDKGPQSRKLYVELAELWPSGYMDDVGIKDAIQRSKERKRAIYSHNKVHNEERIKRRKLASTVRVAETNPAAQLQARQEKPVPIVDSTAQFLAPLEKLGCNRTAATTGRSMDCIPPTNSGHHVSKKPNKVRAVKVSTNSEDTSKASMKKLKKLEPELAETQVHSQRVPIQLVTEKQNFPSFWMTQA
ncbi:ubinuclein-1-like isoform X3 [Musa acuminata AAA Group]|uniref:ubinuclein-1-like isoform X3 n=1 Tax=Musa acuminata AAA Group TaxID=214697 RepID=UPI0031DFF61E